MNCGVAIFFTDYSIGPVEVGTALEERGFESLWRNRNGESVKSPQRIRYWGLTREMGAGWGKPLPPLKEQD